MSDYVHVAAKRSMGIDVNNFQSSSQFNVVRLWGIRLYSPAEWMVVTPLLAVSLSRFDFACLDNRPVLTVNVLCRWRYVRRASNWFVTRAWYGKLRDVCPSA